MSVNVHGTNGLTFNDNTTQATSPFAGGLGFRNRIINGDMRIDQRNNGASVSVASPGTPAYAVDRFFVSGSQTGKLTAQRNAGAVTPPPGFTDYFGVTSSSAYTVGASEAFYVRHHIEGFNTADFMFGTASAQAVTVSFLVRSSLTGSFGGNIANSGFSRSYPFSYTINAANTWEQKSVTIPGDTTGTWLTNNGTGLILTFGIGYGSSLSGATNAWNAGTAFMPTGAVSVVGTNGATFYITGVQLEKGSTATSFDYRDYGRELLMCQRYYEKSYDVSTAIGTATLNGAFLTTRIESVGGGSPFFKVSKRAAPTVTVYSPASGTSGQARNYSASADTPASAQSIGENAFYLLAGSAAVNNGLGIHYTASAEL